MIKSGNNYIFKFYNTKKMKNFSFKNVMYAIGTSLFLIMLIFTLSTSLINPMYGMSEGIMFKSLTSTSSGDCDDECDRANQKHIDFRKYFYPPTRKYLLGG